MLPVSRNQLGFWVSLFLAPAFYALFGHVFSEPIGTVILLVILLVASAFAYRLYRAFEDTIREDTPVRQRARKLDARLHTSLILFVSSMIFIPESAVYDSLRAVLLVVFSIHLVVAMLSAGDGFRRHGVQEQTADETMRYRDTAEVFVLISLPLSIFASGFALAVMHYGRLANSEPTVAFQPWVSGILIVVGCVWLITEGSRVVSERKKKA